MMAFLLVFIINTQVEELEMKIYVCDNGYSLETKGLKR
jgi:hypothetical protein